MECPYCRTNSSLLFIAQDYNRKLSNTPFSYYSCPGCHLIFLSPIPKDLSLYYPSTYYQNPSIEEIEKCSKHELFKIRMIQKFCTKGRLLEIGPSMGAFALLAKKEGFEVEVVEMDGNCCKFLREDLKIPAIQSNNASQAIQGQKPYDIIALWQVIEHLIDPWETLKTLIEDALLPGGLLVLASPNPDSLQFKLCKKRWPHLDAPKHLFLLPINHLIAFLTPLKMTLVLKTTTDKGAIGWNRFGWGKYLSNCIQNPLLKKLLDRTGGLFARGFSFMEKRKDLGSSYTLIFKKESY